MSSYQYELKNVYLGYEFEPSSSTIAYFPFKDDVLDHSGNGITLTNTNRLSKGTLGYNSTMSQGSSSTSITVGFDNGNVKYISEWIKVNSSSGNASGISLSKYGASGYSPSHNASDLQNKFATFTDSSWTRGATKNGITFGVRHHISIGYTGSKMVYSIDGVQADLYNGAGYNFGNGLSLVSIGSNGNINIDISRCIAEDTCWSAQEVLDYYNQTKSLYGITN